MTAQDWIVLVMASVPLVIYLIRGVIDYFRIKNPDEFFLAGRKLTTLNFALNAAATNFSFLTAIFVMLTWSYSYGPAVWWTIISAVAGFLIYSIPKISPIKDKEFFATGNTIHEYLGRRYDSRCVRVLASVATITAFLGFFAASLFIFGGFLTQYIPVNIWFLIIGLAFIIGFYTILGGFESVVKTDILQFLFILIGLGCLLFVLFNIPINLPESIWRSLNPSGLFKAIPPFDSPPPLFIVMLFIINGLWQFSAMDMWQRSLAAKEQKRISDAALLGAAIFAVIAIPIILSGTAIRLELPSGQLKPFELIGRIFQKQNPFVVGGLFALFSSAFLSTGDSNLIALSQSVLYDIVGSLKRKGRDLEPSLRISRITILLIVVGSLVVLYSYMRLSTFNLVTFLLTFFSCQIVLFPSVIYCVIKPGYILPHLPAILSISVGYALSIILGILSVRKPELQAMAPVLSLGFALVVFLVTMPFFKEVPVNARQR